MLMRTLFVPIARVALPVGIRPASRAERRLGRRLSATARNALPARSTPPRFCRGLLVEAEVSRKRPVVGVLDKRTHVQRRRRRGGSASASGRRHVPHMCEKTQIDTSLISYHSTPPSLILRKPSSTTNSSGLVLSSCSRVDRRCAGSGMPDCVRQPAVRSPRYSRRPRFGSLLSFLLTRL